MREMNNKASAEKHLPIYIRTKFRRQEPYTCLTLVLSPLKLLPGSKHQIGIS